MSTEHRQLVYDTWHEFSIVTVDRRNNRDVVKINRSELLKYEQLKTPSENIIEYYKVHYKLHKKVVYISPGEIVCLVVAISKDLTVSIGYHLFLIDTLSRHTSLTSLIGF